MIKTIQTTDKPEAYLNRRTLIIGDVNSGKTRQTQNILEILVNTGHADNILLLDLAPETTKGIGGKLISTNKDVLLLTCPIVPPRLTGKDENEIRRYAEQNARAIDPLLNQAIRSNRSILIINDASLYLQAGQIDRFITLAKGFPTTIINAYFGQSFKQTSFTETERQNVERLFQLSDNIIRL